MNLHEYQSKQLFREFGLPVPEGSVAESVDDAIQAAKAIGGNRWVCKVQAHAGGRGKAGGVRLVDDLEGVRTFAEEWIGKRLVTFQTDAVGRPVDQVYIEPVSNIDRELYLGLVIDRSSKRVVVMASTEGGVEIEKVAAETPDKILSVFLNPLVGPMAYQARSLALQLGFNSNQVREFTNLFLNICRMFVELDCSLVEVNPFVITAQGNVLCLDAKVNVDNNALFRQQTVEKMRDVRQEDEREAQATKFGLSYVALDGNIGCMVNGAGLAMGTMDLVKLHGGEPANFLDVGGGVSTAAVGEAFKIILSDSNVQAVLINIFGGIVSCATIAKGIVGAIKDACVSVPVVVRFDGNSAELGSGILRDSGLNVIATSSLSEAASAAVKAAA